MGRQKLKGKESEKKSCFLLKAKKDTSRVKLKRKRKKPSTRVKGEKMAEELAVIDKRFTIIEREMLPEDHESVSKCENENSKLESLKTVTCNDIEGAIESIASL